MQATESTGTGRHSTAARGPSLINPAEALSPARPIRGEEEEPGSSSSETDCNVLLPLPLGTWGRTSSTMEKRSSLTAGTPRAVRAIQSASGPNSCRGLRGGLASLGAAEDELVAMGLREGLDAALKVPVEGDPDELGAG